MMQNDGKQHVFASSKNDWSMDVSYKELRFYNTLALLPGNSTCTEIQASGSCQADSITNPTDVHGRALRSYCGVTCGRCQEGEFFCTDRAVPGGLSGEQFQGAVAKLTT
jgi:hypothetical protein